jgi:hypothetical protein
VAERRAATRGLPPAGATVATLDPALPSAAPASAPESEAAPPPQAPLSPDEQRQEAEAQLAAADIEFVASAHNVQVRQCHERAFKEAPGGSPGGKVELSFTLTEDGRAVGVATVVNTTGSERLARCLEQRVSEWRFPRPVGGAKVYQFPFVFLPEGGR